MVVGCVQIERMNGMNVMNGWKVECESTKHKQKNQHNTKQNKNSNFWQHIFRLFCINYNHIFEQLFCIKLHCVLVCACTTPTSSSSSSSPTPTPARVITAFIHICRWSRSRRMLLDSLIYLCLKYYNICTEWRRWVSFVAVIRFHSRFAGRFIAEHFSFCIIRCYSHTHRTFIFNWLLSVAAMKQNNNCVLSQNANPIQFGIHCMWGELKDIGSKFARVKRLFVYMQTNKAMNAFHSTIVECYIRNSWQMLNINHSMTQLYSLNRVGFTYCENKPDFILNKGPRRKSGWKLDRTQLKRFVEDQQATQFNWIPQVKSLSRK